MATLISDEIRTIRPTIPGPQQQGGRPALTMRWMRRGGSMAAVWLHRDVGG